MRSSQRNFLLLLVLLYLCHVQCLKDDNTESGTTHHQNKQHDSDIPHKLERAPIPAVHTGPQPSKFERKRRSAPIALDHRFGTLAFKEEALARVNRHITPGNNSPNPQKPFVRNAVTKDNNFTSTHFNHPGQFSQNNQNNIVDNKNSDINNIYNYYSTGKAYGSAYQYGPNQPFKGYVETDNIGVIPPRDVNARAYYNSISGFRDLPIIGQHSNSTFQSLYGGQVYSTYGYGRGVYDKNFFKNLVTQLVKWMIKDAVTNGQRYAIYNRTTIPEDFPKQITLSNETLAECLEPVSIFCQKHTGEPICTTNGTMYCISSGVISCQNTPSDICAKIKIPCGDCEAGRNNNLPCAANVTISSENANNEDIEVKDIILCATLLAIPIPKETESFEKMSQNTSDAKNNLKK